MKADYYEVLGVSPDATVKQIKAAYHQLALKLHPDHGGSALALAAVNEAAEVLTDAKKKAAYDLDRRLERAKGGQATTSGARRAPEPEPARPRQKVTIALCEFCDTLNRVKDDPDFVPATCGHCGRPLGKARKANDAAPDAAKSDEKPSPPPSTGPGATPAGKDDEKVDSYAKILADAANQLFSGGMKQATKNLPGADKILEGLQELTDHLAKRGERKEPSSDPQERARDRLEEMETYIRRMKDDGK